MVTMYKMHKLELVNILNPIMKTIISVSPQIDPRIVQCLSACLSMN